MEMKPGYKRTEVGVIPEDWEVLRVGDIASFKSGVGIHVAKLLPESSDASAPVYGGNGIAGYTTRPLVQNPMLVIGRVGQRCGEVYLTKGPSWITDNALYPRTLHRAVHLPFLASALIATGLNDLKNRNDLPLLTQSILHAVQIGIPATKAEQEAIAEVLSDADALIESLEQLLAKKRQIKQGATQELLTGKKRLQGFTIEWEPSSLGTIADPNQRWSFTGGPFGSNLKSSDYTEAGVRIIQLQNIGDGVFKESYEIYTSPQKADELLSCNIYPGDIILSKMGDPVARACIIPPQEKRYLMCSDGIRLAVDEKRFNTYFIYTLINGQEFRTRAANAGTGSTRKRIGLTELRGLELRCPLLPEQTAIAAILGDLDAEIAALEAKLAKARSIKQGMMQELLTGSIRLV